MKRKLFFYNNTCKIKIINLYTDLLDVDLNVNIMPHKNTEINFETENVVFLKLSDRDHIYKLDLFTNSISFDLDNVKFFTLPRINYF